MNKAAPSSPQQPYQLEGKVVVLTGATGILGRQYSQTFAEQGAQLVVADLNPSVCEEFAAELTASTGAKVWPMAVDLSQESSIVAWSKKIISECGTVDVLMNNAAAKADGFFAPLESYSLQTWNEVMAVNVNAVFLATRELGPVMAKKGKGSIINVASIYGLVGPDQRIYEGSWYPEMGGAINTPMIYAASKGAVVAMTRYLATYWGQQGVRCNCITPGGVSSGQNEAFDKAYSQRTPMGRMAKGHEMVGAALYLASDASSYVNGHNLVVDGGWTAW